MNVVHVLPAERVGDGLLSHQPGTSRTTNEQQQEKHWGYAEKSQINADTLNKATETANRLLGDSNTKVELEFDHKSQRCWVNLVDKSSGKVVYDIPPESVRKIIDGLSTSGIMIDTKG